LNEFAIIATPSTTWSNTPRCTKIRDPHTQPCPECTKMPSDAIRMALFMSASSKISTGDFPPSSSMTFFKFPADARTISLPTSVDPVKATFSTSGCAVIAAPAVWP
jgi:hypothetical protein